MCVSSLIMSKPSKSERVHAALEDAVATETAVQSKGRAYRLLDRDVEFCIYMLEKHGEDYEANTIR